MRRPLNPPRTYALIACLLLGCSAGGDGAPITGPAVDASAQDAPGDDASFLDAAMVEAGSCAHDGGRVTVQPDDDYDGDGWSLREGDCNGCGARANPGAFDVAGSGVDEDCSGVVDDEPGGCDVGIAVGTNVPEEGARAIGLCRFTSAQPASPKARTWGVVDAAFTLADGSLAMHHASRGVLPDFGPRVAPQAGVSLLALSSAAARRPGDPSYVPPREGDMKTTSPTPPGWPKDFPTCATPVDTAPIANDGAALSLHVRVPTNASALSFRFNFYTTEFPTWVCHQYNDYFVALLETSADNPGAQDGNISFDQNGTPISVNSAFLEVCLPQVVGDRAYACLLGDAALAGNGFGPSDEEPRGHASTGWLETRASVSPGELIALRFAVWDAGDHLRGSTVLIDDFRWDAEPASAPETVRVDPPK